MRLKSTCITLIEDMYQDGKTKILCEVGESKNFEAIDGLHQFMDCHFQYGGKGEAWQPDKFNEDLSPR